MDDLTIKKNVEEELQYEPILNAAAIGVAVKDGIVTLTGKVSNLAQKYAAARAATWVSGVRAVANEIEVALLPSDIRTDEDVARSAVNALTWNRQAQGVHYPTAVRFACVEAHLRKLVEQGFEVAWVEDVTSGPQHPELGDGYASALVNFGFITSGVLTTDEVVKGMG